MQKQLISFLLLLSLAIISCKQDATDPNLQPNYKFDNNTAPNIKLCVYLDNGVFDACKTNTVNMLNEMHCNYTAINRDSILSGALNHYSLLLMPGGDMWTYGSYLSTNGMTKIKSFVNGGGGYVGICGGSYFAANLIVWRGWANEPRNYITTNGLSLFPATADGPIENFAPTYVDSKCKITIAQTGHPILAELPAIIEPYYDHGPMFLFTDSLNISTLGKTVNGNKKILLTFQYGSGKVFLTGAHPEADNSRNAWVLIKNAIKWCSK